MGGCEPQSIAYFLERTAPEPLSRPSCAALSGPWTLTSPEPGAAFQGLGANVGDPYLSADGLSLFVSLSDHEIAYVSEVATRPDVNRAFSARTRNALLGARAAGVSRFALSDDGLRAYVSAIWPGGLGETDLWFSERTTTREPFERFENLTTLNSPAHEYDVWPSPNERRLYFARDVDGKDSRVMVAERPSRSEAFAAPAELPGLAASPIPYEGNPALTPDDLFIVYNSNGPDNTSSQVYFAGRTSPEAPFEPPQLLPAINVAGQKQGEPALWACELYFVRLDNDFFSLYRSTFVAR